jgi:aminoglycoside phosphotransferase (APT) family kinase protein
MMECSDMPSPDAAHVHQILHLVGLEADEIELAGVQGVANDTWLCGQWVVRVSKDREYLEDLFTESVAAPAAFRAGVRTPAPVCFSLEPNDGLPPYSVWHRAEGANLSSVQELRDPGGFFRAYGEGLAVIHGVTETPDPHGWLDPAWELDLDDLTKKAREAGVWDLAARLVELPAPDLVRFVHQDLHAENVLVGRDGLPVFLDWVTQGGAIRQQTSGLFLLSSLARPLPGTGKRMEH